MKSLDTRDISDLLPKRPQRSNKYTFGVVLAVCGSESMCGAAYLCAKAAYLAGCGLVKILTPRVNAAVLQTLLPEAIVSRYGSLSAAERRDIREMTEHADAVVLGPGLGQGKTAERIVSLVLENVKVPAVLDADALNILSRNKKIAEKIKDPGQIIITPHMKEMERLSGYEAEYILSNTVEAAEKFAAEHGVICVLKDHRTVICGNNETYVNKYGNSALATAGSGDVLAGLTAGLLSQRKNGNADLVSTAALSVLIHSLAGVAASEDLGEYSVTASDISDRIPTILKKYGKEEGERT